MDESACSTDSHGRALLAYLRTDRRPVAYGTDFLRCPNCLEWLYDERDRAEGRGSPFVDDLKRARRVLAEAALKLEALPVKRRGLRATRDLVLDVRTEALKLDDTLAVFGHGAQLPVTGYLSPGHDV